MASFDYYGGSLGWIDDAERTQYSRRGDRFSLLGCVMLFLAPSLILFTVRLLTVASWWFGALAVFSVVSWSTRRGRAPRRTSTL